MKKLISIAIVLSILMSNAFAADNPLYLYDYDRSKTDEAIDPLQPVFLDIPAGTAAFSFSFENKDIQYSDYEIDFVDIDSDMIVYYKSNSCDFDVTISLIMLGTSEIVYSKEISVTKNWQKLCIDRKYNKNGALCYIALTDPSVDGLLANGKIIVTGTTGSGKEVVLTRAKFAIKLAELLNFDTAIEDEAPFDDVGIYNYPYKAVMTLKKAGVVKGTGNNLFAPNDKITYAQAFYMAARLFVDDETIEAAAPYPLGGAVICSQLGLTSEINAAIDDSVTQVGCMHLFNNIRDICKSDEYECLCQ